MLTHSGALTASLVRTFLPYFLPLLTALFTHVRPCFLRMRTRLELGLRLLLWTRLRLRRRRLRRRGRSWRPRG